MVIMHALGCSPAPRPPSQAYHDTDVFFDALLSQNRPIVRAVFMARGANRVHSRSNEARAAVAFAICRCRFRAYALNGRML
jgi:ribosomal protein S14